MKALKKYRYEPTHAIPPGETLKDVMEDHSMTQKELALRTGLTVQSLNRISKGEQPLTHDTALKLEFALGIPARIWNNLEMQYREQCEQQEQLQRMNSDLKWLKTIPTKELVARGILENNTDKTELLYSTLKFYGVSSVDAWNNIWDTPAVAARRSSCFSTHPGAASSWIRQGEIEAHTIETSPFDRTTFKKELSAIRLLTCDNPETFMPEIITLCSSAGVAVVLIPEMKRVPWNGATKWISSDKAMIVLNLRGKCEDIFWFSFFHEASHILHDNKTALYINDGLHDDPKELKADKFAAEFLIPAKYNKHITTFTCKEEFIALADTLRISPAIVVGRYQHLTSKWNKFTSLKRIFQWTK